MSQLTLFKDAVLGRSRKDLRDGVEEQEEERAKRGESIGEVDESGKKDEDLKDYGSNIAQSHLGRPFLGGWGGQICILLSASKVSTV
jgi:hypothetical protein